MKTFIGGLETKEQALIRARQFREQGLFHAFGHYWYKNKGNVSGAMYHQYLKPGEVEQDVIKYPPDVHRMPVDMAHLIDIFFSGLSLHKDKTLHQQWAERVYSAIKPGAFLVDVPDKLIVHMLERPEWLAAYADQKGAHMTGLMHSIFTLRMNGIHQDGRLKDFYYDHIHKMYPHQMDGDRDTSNHVRAALSSLSQIPISPRGCMSNFLSQAIQGSARHNHSSICARWVDLSDIFIRMIKDAK